MMGQKEAVVNHVKVFLPGFVLGHDVALMMLTKEQLESLKNEIGVRIMCGDIEYGKPLVKAEVVAYARSMVMNHLKKAKELNGGVTYGKTTTQVAALKKDKALSDIDMTVLPEDLSEFVKTLV